jgi:hypothetical protein
MGHGENESWVSGQTRTNWDLVMSLAVTYLPLFMPPPGGAKGATGTEAPAPAAL